MLKFEHIGFAYGKKKIFSDFSLSIPDGARLAFMGASGSGKSTLLRLAAGLLTPQAGRIDGIPNGVAYVFQESRLVPQLTALENVLLVRADETLARQLLEALGLGAELHALPSELSGGMARRVALARALAYRSPLLVLDEAFSGLDDATRETAAGVILRHASDRTILAATHSEIEAELLGAKIIKL